MTESFNNALACRKPGPVSSFSSSPRSLSPNDVVGERGSILLSLPFLKGGEEGFKTPKIPNTHLYMYS